MAPNKHLQFSVGLAAPNSPKKEPRASAHPPIHPITLIDWQIKRPSTPAPLTPSLGSNGN